MQSIELEGRLRTECGTRSSRALRAQGHIPIVIYGKENAQPMHATVPKLDVDKMLRHHLHLVSVVFSDGTKETGLVRDVQFEPVTDQVLHFDLFHVSVDKKIDYKVELEFVGHAKGSAAGGKFTHDLAALPITCLPTQIPDKISVRIGNLDIGDQITAGELELPTGVELAVPPERVVCHVMAFLKPEASALDEEEAGPSEPEVIGKKEDSEESGGGNS